MQLNKTLSKKIFENKITATSLRDGYGSGILELGESNEKVVVLSTDVTESTRNLEFKEKFPNRFISVGVAEQNMAGIAAGLALSGRIPYMNSFSVFSPGRNWEQIRISICFSKANVKIIGHHSGLSVGQDGATHQALEDIAITRVLPNMTVLVPADALEVKKAVFAAAKHIGPVYIRIHRDPTPVFTTEETEFEIGKAQVLKTGSDLTLVACGPLVYKALIAAKELNENHHINVEVINFSTIKPFDVETLIKSASKTKRVVTLEDHQIIGGLGSATAEALSENMPVLLKRIGVNDTFGESGKPEELFEKHGLDVRHIVAVVRDTYHKK